MTDPIRFEDGAAYEPYMGTWSRLAGDAFLDWLTPPRGARWLDVGCGNGAFTELVVERCAPAQIDGIDPSDAQLVFARERPRARMARFQRGDAMVMPFAAAAFDVAVMPLVLFFVPEPRRGVAEMVRVVRPGGAVAAYCWDMPGGGFPYEVLRVAMRELGVPVPEPPHPDASRLDAMRDLWRGAGLADVATTELVVERAFASFAEYWRIVRGGPSVGPKLAAMSPDALAVLEARLRERLRTDDADRIVCTARANAVRGAVT
jgi:SAM-dependent methyltransferase